MQETEFKRIKQRILSVDPAKYWGDDFDVRYYAISKLKETKNQLILDAGGGIGIISSEMDESNSCVNLDLNLSELILCKTKMSNTIQNINALLRFLPFKDSTFDQIICCHVLDAGKAQDINNNKVINEKTSRFPTVETILNEFKRILKVNGKLTLTVPNNAFYQKMAFEYDELKAVLLLTFPKHSVYYFNTLPKFGSNRKLNLANTIPKLTSKIVGQNFVLERLIQEENRKPRYSISFYVEAFKS